MSLFGKKSSEGESELVLLCDIGSARVAGALVLLREGGTPQILYRTEHPIVFQKDLDFSRFTLSMLESLEAMLESVETEGLRHIHIEEKRKGHHPIVRTICVYASPWHLSQTKVLHHKEEKDTFRVTQELIDSIVEEEGRTFTQNELAEYAESVGTDMELIEQQITGITLDGYTVSQPVGHDTHELSFVVTVTMMASALRNAVTERVQKYLHVRDIRHHSFGYVGFVALRDVFHDEENFLLVDVTGEISDVSLIQNDILLNSVSFPYGSRNIIRSVAKTHGTEPDTARSMVHNFVAGHGHAEITKTITNAQDAWGMHFVDALNTVRGVGSLPQTVFCIVDESLGTLFQDALVSSFKQLRTTHKKDNIVLLSAGMLQGHIDFRAGITEDPFLALEALYAHRSSALAENK